MIEPLSHCGDVCSACTPATTSTTTSQGGVQWITDDPNVLGLDPADGTHAIQYVGDYIPLHHWYWQPELEIWK